MTSFSLYCDWCSNIALGYLRTNRCLHYELFRFVEFWVQEAHAIHMWGVLVYIHVGSIYIILVIRIELYLLLLLLKWLKMGDWNEQIVDPVLPSVNDIVKIEQNTHAYVLQDLQCFKFMQRPVNYETRVFYVLTINVQGICSIKVYKNNILINSESLLKESYYHTQMQSLCTS